MRLLITTQAIDEKDDHFVFFLDWIREFSKTYEKITVVALRVGAYTLPEQVEVISLGKNEGKGRLTYLYRFFSVCLGRVGQYDHVFVHMNPEYVVLAGLWWRLMGKRVGLWYTHKEVNWKLRIAHFFANYIFTAVPESFRIVSNKVHVVGHGINTELFSPQEVQREKLEILTVSRIAPIKHIEDMIEALPLIQKELGKEVVLTVVSKIPEERDPYFQKLQSLIKERGLTSSVLFVGAVPGDKLPAYYNHATITFNLTPTGGLDKAVLESLSCGVPVVASNQALRPLFGTYQDMFSVELGNVQELAQKAVQVIQQAETMKEGLRALVVDAYSYRAVVKKIITIYETGR